MQTTVNRTSEITSAPSIVKKKQTNNTIINSEKIGGFVLLK